MLLITETNVPRADKIAYFGSPLPGGERCNEAPLVYQFPLPPLILHRLATGDSTALSKWAGTLGAPQQVIAGDPRVFSLARTSSRATGTGSMDLLCLVEVSGNALSIETPLEEGAASAWHDLLSGERYRMSSGMLETPLAPYQVRWLAAET